MAIGYNPTTVTEGLIYYIDPNNNRSYSGIGNTVYNLVNSGFGGTFVGSTASPLDSTNTRTFYLNNSTNYINGPNNIALTNNFTVSVWFKIGVYNTGSIIGKWFWDGTSAHRCWIINTDVGGSIAVVLSSDGTYTNPTIKRYLVPVNLNEYTQITFTFASGTLLVYKNGVLATVTQNLNGTFSTVFNAPTRPIQIGYFYDFANYYSLGNVGVAQIYNRVLSPSEILQNYNATKKRYLPEEQIVTDGLILNLDPGNPRSYSGTGNTIYDLAGFGNTGTLTNGPTFSVLNGGSIFFDGSNDSIVFSRNNILSGTQNFTIEAFIYPITTNAEHIFGNYNNGNTAGLELYLQTEKVYLWYGNTFTASISNIQKYKWHHLCATRNGNSISLYINGLLDNTGTNSNSIGTNSFYTIGNGYDYNTEAFSGNISQVKVYSKALSSQEVQQNYNATKNRFINVLPPVRDNLILELDAGNLSSYPGSGTTWFDLSGNNLNSTLVGSPTYTFNDSASFITFDANTKSGTLSTSILNNYSSGTIECSVFITNLTSSFILTRQRNGFNSYNIFSVGSYADGGGTLVTGTSGIVYYHNKNAQTVLSSSTALLANTWYRLSITFTTSAVILYINGVQNATVAGDYSVPNESSTDPRIGAWIKDGTNYPMNGRLAHFTVYNRALSAAEIAQNFNFYRTRYGI